ncbi:MAG: 3-deoxy-8-phosphooctulonate synthase [Candidatus Schekmanbacteria bacterium RBG_16_38_11]|uniref:2-dehydro-3-deoxyphosphooctonate aldolase n=1 Tax=Candidatus Schekmanbacteria bacterium RBG_16_38_11 TaxID=1817880 RepID=A0A1F7RTG4_9BACT|nr:MAG: 3-deoxy-8-phosphooctulonate synthase [Candidatus Schekmanbacteria bacterium RBG_16_38_11]
MNKIKKITKTVKVGNIGIGNGNPFLLIAGPCVIESRKSCIEIAARLKDLCQKVDVPLIFKTSFDKANRSSVDSYRGPGIEKGLDVLSEIKDKLKLPVLSDVHRISEVDNASKVLDVIQVPAFLCRQTDLLQEIAKKGKPINIKKGQFLAPWDTKNIIEKIEHKGNKKILLTERGTSFGYNNLVVDFRGIAIMRRFGYPVGFDATHSVQLPGGAGKSSSGEREFVMPLTRSALAFGCDFIYMEVHKNPKKALCDGPNMVDLKELERILKIGKRIDKLIKEEGY